MFKRISKRKVDIAADHRRGRGGKKSQLSSSELSRSRDAPLTASLSQDSAYLEDVSEPFDAEEVGDDCAVFIPVDSGSPRKRARCGT